MPESIWSVLGMLAIVILILFLAYWATRWIGSASARSTVGRLRGGGRMEIVEQLSLGRDQRILLLRLGGRCYLLGASVQGVTLLKELTGEEARDCLAAPEQSAASSSFLDVLKENLHKK